MFITFVLTYEQNKISLYATAERLHRASLIQGLTVLSLVPLLKNKTYIVQAFTKAKHTTR